MSKKFALIILIIGLVFLGSGLLLAQVSAEGGILSEITNVTIGDDEIPVVTFTLSDANGAPLSLEDVESVRFLIDRIDEDEITGLPRYYNYFSDEVEGIEYQLNGETLQPALETVNQPAFESGEGAFAEVEPGVYTYTFAEPLGDDFSDVAPMLSGPRLSEARAMLPRILFLRLNLMAMSLVIRAFWLRQRVVTIVTAN